MADKSTAELELLITAQAKQFEKELNGVQSQLNKLKETGEKTSKSLGGGFKSALPEISAFTIGIAAGAAAIGTLASAFQRATAFQDTMADLSAITGVAGAGLEDIGNKATELSNKFGTSAVENVDAFKGVLSRLGPDIASNSSALQAMGDHINTLAIAAGLDATQSMDALTTAMLQFGVDLSDPAFAAQEMGRMMNVMAAGAQQGAAEVPQIAQALVVAGVSAKSAGVSFEETNAALQVLATGGLYGSEAGTALRNVFVRLQAPTADAAKMMSQFGIDSRAVAETLTRDGLQAAVEQMRDGFDKIKSPVDRAALLNKVFGESAQNAASILMGQSDALADLTVKMTGTNTATAQAEVKMQTFSMQMKILGEQVMNQVSGAFTAMAPALTSVAKALGTVVPLMVEYAPAILSVVAGYLAVNNAVLAYKKAEMLLQSVLKANPYVLLAAGIAVAIQSYKSISEHARDLAQAQRDQNKTAQDGVAKMIATKKEALGVAESNLSLIESYEELGKKQNKTADETKKYNKVVTELQTKYPGIIEAGKSFDEGLAKIRETANKTRGEIKGLNEEIAKLNKDQQLLQLENSSLAVGASLETMVVGLESAFGISADTMSKLEIEVGKYIGEITSAENKSQGLAKAQRALQKILSEEGVSVESNKNAWLAAVSALTDAANAQEKYVQLSEEQAKANIIERNRKEAAAVLKVSLAEFDRLKLTHQMIAATDKMKGKTKEQIDQLLAYYKTLQLTQTKPTDTGGAPSDKPKKEKNTADPVLEQLKLERRAALDLLKIREASASSIALTDEYYNNLILNRLRQTKAEENTIYEAQNEVIAATATLNKELMRESWDLTRTALRDMGIDIDNKAKEFQRLKDAVDAYNVSVQDPAAVQAIADSADAMDLLSGKTEYAKTVAENLEPVFGTLGDVIAQGVSGGADAMKQGLKALLNSILDFINAQYIAAGAAVALRALISGGLSAFVDVSGYAAASIAVLAARAAINSFAVGTDYVTKDQLAMVHKGEMIIPKTFAEGVRSGEVSVTGTQSTNTEPTKRKGPSRVKTPTMHISSFRGNVNQAAWENSRGFI